MALSLFCITPGCLLPARAGTGIPNDLPRGAQGQNQICTLTDLLKSYRHFLLIILRQTHIEMYRSMCYSLENDTGSGP